MEGGYIKHNPAQLSSSTLRNAGKQEAQKDVGFPSKTQLQQLIDEAPDSLRLLYVLCLAHGLRIGEALALERSDIEIVTSPQRTVVICVNKNVQRILDSEGHSIMIVQPTKTDAGCRNVPLIRSFFPELDDHLKRLEKQKVRSQLLFPSRLGGYRTDTSVRELLDRTRKKVGLENRIGFHVGRKILVTNLAEMGATPAEIGAITGQKDLATITQTYMKVRQSRPETLMKRLDRVYSTSP